MSEVCAHPAWVNLPPTPGTLGNHGPLACVSCGVPWPGEQLPKPYLPYEGYGLSPVDRRPWGRRVDAKLHQLGEREEERAAAIQRELAMIAPGEMPGGPA